MRLINLDNILKKFPKADFDGDDLENMKAYPHWKTDITGLFSILKSVPTIETCEDCISREEALRLIDEERQHLLRLNMDGTEHIIVHYARRIIEDMPSASSVDCIDRQKTIAEIQYKYYDNAIGIDIIDMIAHMPAAIPEQLGEHFAEGYKKGVGNEQIRT